MSCFRTELFSFFQKQFFKKRSWALYLLLFPGSLFFELLVFVKNFLYDHKILFPRRVAITVISIGNLSVGGSGKTPLILFLADKFHRKGRKVAIISRGYGSLFSKKNEPTLLFPEGKYSYEEVGDEALLYLKRAPFCQVIIGKDKYKSQLLAQERGANLILLDDGFQSRYLHRDLDIVLLKKRVFTDSFLPLGPLRERVGSLKRADLIICDFEDERIEKKIIACTGAPLLFLERKLTGIKDLYGGEKKELDKVIAIFSAIADPESFKKFLEVRGSKIVDEEFFLDHSKIDLLKLKKLSQRAKEKGALILLCTEKDAVKLPQEISLVLPIYFVEMDVEISHKGKKIEELLLK